MSSNDPEILKKHKVALRIYFTMLFILVWTQIWIACFVKDSRPHHSNGFKFLGMLLRGYNAREYAEEQAKKRVGSMPTKPPHNAP